MIVGAVDIGSNSVRMLIRDGYETELERRVEVTGLASGVDATGLLDSERLEATIEILTEYGQMLDGHAVVRRAAVATSASRDATNGADAMTQFAQALGVVPEIISGEREAHLSFGGATHGKDGGSTVVIDIGGGSTEVVVGSHGTPMWTHSYDIGSVRLTDRSLSSRPATARELEAARMEMRSVLTTADLPEVGSEGIGVGGTFTSLAAMHLGLETYDRTAVDGSVLNLHILERLVTHLASMTVEETAAIPSLHPRRAPVILSGAVVAHEVTQALGIETVVVSERDLLDGVADDLLAGV